MLDIKNLKVVGTRTVSRSVLMVRKYSPEILTTVGVVGVVAAAVLGAKATLKLEETVDEMRSDIDYVHRKQTKGSEDYSDLDFKRDITTAYVKGTKNVVKLYAPAVTLGLASIGCIVGAHGIMRKRNVAIAAAYKAMESSFAEYRKRVAEELGEDQERDIRFNVKEEGVVGEDGKEHIVKKSNGLKHSEYAKCFDEYSTAWRKTADYNLQFLRFQQQYANDRLQSRGHLFLNEVYDSLGLPHTQAGAVVGWVVDSKNGDTFVDFGIYDIDNENARAFINGFEKAIWLDFNVDGVIYDLLP